MASPESPAATDTGNVTKFPDCPHAQLINLYHECMPANRRVKVSRWVGSKSETNLRARWREGLKSEDRFFRYSTQEEGLAVWRKFFETCARSDFLCGRTLPSNGREVPFMADLHWLVNRTNFDKVLSNRYHGDAGRPATPVPGERQAGGA